MNWYQVSSKFRMVARLPEGKTGIQALVEAKDAGTDNATYLDDELKAFWRADHRRWANALGERNAGDHFLRCHADGDLCRTLTPAEWADFKRNGGTTYDAAAQVSRKAGEP